MFAGVMLIALLCFAGTPRVFMQKVGDTCSSDADCTTTVEACVSTKCECAANHINKGSKTCISEACSAAADATACNALPNFACVNSVCGCNSISSLVTTAGETKGTCAIKTCSANSECTTNGDANSECSRGSCACTATYELKAGVCALKIYGDSCTSDANCADISATDAVCDTSSNVCKIAVDKTCSTTTDNCVTNGECDSTTTKCKCKANYVADSTGKLCVAENGVGIVAASLGALLITLLLQVSLL